MNKLVVLSLFLLSIVYISSSVYAVGIYTTNSAGESKHNFYDNETVYVDADQNVTNTSKTVRIYVISDTNSISDNSSITSVKTFVGVTTDSDGRIPLTQLPSLFAAGSYDIILDSGADGFYNASEDFINATSGAAFVVAKAPKPSLEISRGDNSSSDRTINNTDLAEYTMLQLRIKGDPDHDVFINRIDLEARGTGDDLGVDKIKIHSDNDADGKVSSGDNIIYIGRYESDNSILGAGMNYLLNSNQTKYLIITYTMSGTSYNKDNFWFNIPFILFNSTGGQVSYMGLPITSSNLTITGEDRPTTGEGGCTGVLSALFTESEDMVSAAVTGLSNCDGRSVDFREGSCSGATITSCSLIASSCATSFPKPAEGNHTYFACLDKNQDGSYSNDEMSSWTLSVPVSPLKPVTDFLSNYLTVIIISAAVVVGAVVLYKRLGLNKEVPFIVAEPKNN